MSSVAQFAPEIPLAEQVKIEALAHGRRMEQARQLSATIKGPGAAAYRLSDRIKAIAEQLDREDEAERRRAEAERLRTPSGLIKEMREEWPAQSSAVCAMAEANGIRLGEQWAKVIAAGVKALKG